ncbi:DUF1127 domain-containing protein [Falsigemmobacter faecalis]|uniref:DUF1127 domain-containing protein n=1 Tax=Falsigemmobacter faecalis TaxID=2488730 RepID=A0A3P3DGV0_9RHOB|nr:DUF1127 domain-containing protein [Falsigemmobacter faecalis]RRH73485.1 DUF1127 domain-containing protein [Falsigemmobacter faecalis]
MAAFETTRPMQGSIGGGLSSFFRSVTERLLQWNDLRVTRKALARLSDRELDDIGLCRGDLENISAHLR